MNSCISGSALRRSLRSRRNLFWNSHGVQKSCPAKGTSLPRFYSTQGLVKPYYVTTPIFYVNADPHIGHLYTMILADILKRWQALQGKLAILCTGTDEHGMKIQEAATRARTSPREFCDNGAETFKSLAQRAGLSHDHFVRTTDQEHKDTVRHVWKKLWDKGYIYASKHEGWYCVSDETFYPESAIEKRLNPFDGRTFMASSETGNEVEWTSEANYHFPLKAFKDRLLEFYKQNPHFVVPKRHLQNVIDWVTYDLKDLSISRPAERLKWGIRVPGDETQTIYVWLDALVNYITKAGYPWEPGNETAGGWPADVQVIGKDIVRFHCIYWPAFLLALDIAPPKQVLTHAHWTMGNEKMSKSTGNVVNPFFAIDRFGIDTMRFYLAHEGGIEHDSNYSNEHIATIYKKNLLGGVGGLLSRVTRTKTWNVRKCVEAAPFGDRSHWSRFTKAQRESVEGLRSSVAASFVKLNPSSALRQIVQVIHETNKYITDESPWSIAKSEDPIDRQCVLRTVYHCAEALRVAGILLQPFMPGKAKTLLDTLGVDDSRRTYDDAQFGVDASYGEPRTKVGNGKWDSLFPPLSVEYDEV